jgi:hypothetical protein
LGTINSVTTAAGSAHLPGSDGILPTPPVLPKTHHLARREGSGVRAVTTAAGSAHLPGSDGILPTPPVPPKTPHLLHDDLRHRLDPRRLVATSATPRPTMSPPVNKPTPPAPPLPRHVPAITPSESDLRVHKTVAAARRLRSQKSQLRRQAAMLPPPPETQPPPGDRPHLRCCIRTRSHNSPTSSFLLS